MQRKAIIKFCLQFIFTLDATLITLKFKDCFLIRLARMNKLHERYGVWGGLNHKSNVFFVKV